MDLEREKRLDEQSQMKDLDYLNLKALMIETKEFHRMCSELQAYLTDKEDPVPPAPQPEKEPAKSSR